MTARDNNAHYELYRKSTLGVCLSDCLEELIKNNTITSELALKILKQFDASINEALATKVKSKASFKGHLHTYRFVDNVWTLILENCTFKTESETITTDKVKIVACDGSLFKKSQS